MTRKKRKARRRREYGKKGRRLPPNDERQPVVSFISLGCHKNTVDTERLLGALLEDGFFLAEDPADADVVLVNTCAFLETAREETRRVMEEMAVLKKDPGVAPLLVAALGCGVEYQHGVVKNGGAFLDAADHKVGFADYPRLPAILRKAIGFKPHKARDSRPCCFYALPRLSYGSPHLAYLKISEGCSNRCSYCLIPSIRGPQRSVPVERLVEEAAQLAGGGAREIDIIAQDTAAYGIDLHGKPALPQLLEELRKTLTENVWLRVMYAHPAHVTREMLGAMRRDERVCPYIDLPLQHLSGRVLEKMGRKMTGRIDRLLDTVREILDEPAIRTTFIVGHPGERESDFLELLDAVQSNTFEHVGIFEYSREPGTDSALMDEQVPFDETRRRAEALAQAAEVAAEMRNSTLVGKILPVMLDTPAPKADSRGEWLGRTIRDAPEIDRQVWVLPPLPPNAGPGTVIDVEIVSADCFDLTAKTTPAEQKNRER